MMRALILLLSFFVADGTDRVITTCTAEACLTLHLEEKRFEKASENCVNNGGNLVTMRDENEFQSVKSALLAAEDSILNSKLWIGLELLKKNCTDFTEELHGFRWTSDPKESKYSKWKKKPLSTCTEKRCVSTSLADGLTWTDGSCRDRAFYMCKFLSKGMCEPIVMEEPGVVKYNLPFLQKPQTQNEKLAMLPHGTWGEILCDGSEEAESSFPVCDNKDGIFGWTNSKRFCARDKRSCERKNGGCDHLCSETAGEVLCECRNGYYLKDDRVSCALRNNCENSPCEFECIPTGTWFSCACAEGFHLAEDNIKCADIDECHQPVCGEHVCVNTPGSYLCECNTGFRLVSDKCEDVDECTEFRCDQGCLNSHGSFSCYCHTGYISTSDDKGTCIDVDECLGKPCEDICLNTVGSFKCSCRENFMLAKNGISCVPDPTEKAQTTPSPDHREAFVTKLSQSPVSFESTTINPPPLNRTNTKVDSTKRQERFLGSYWMLVCVLASVVPLVALVLISGVVIYRRKRSRKATMKNATADNYCWVSSGLDKERKQTNIQLNN